MLASKLISLDFENENEVSTCDYQGIDVTTNTTTISGNTINYCSGCGQWYNGCHTCWHQWPQTYLYPITAVPQRDEVRELKAWIDGFMESRKMTERNLQKIMDKLEEFCE